VGILDPVEARLFQPLRTSRGLDVQGHWPWCAHESLECHLQRRSRMR
jgi:hypothetical protein